MRLLLVLSVETEFLNLERNVIIKIVLAAHRTARLILDSIAEEPAQLVLEKILSVATVSSKRPSHAMTETKLMEMGVLKIV